MGNIRKLRRKVPQSRANFDDYIFTIHLRRDNNLFQNARVNEKILSETLFRADAGLFEKSFDMLLKLLLIIDITKTVNASMNC